MLAGRQPGGQLASMKITLDLNETPGRRLEIEAAGPLLP